MINRFLRKRPGFTLIESLAVIAIFGILIALGSYLFVQAQSQARDVARKSDLAQIAQGFEARKLDRTCSDQSQIGLYPGQSLELANGGIWTKVSQLRTYSDGCGAFTNYLPIIPDDSRSPAFSYYFNLSTTEVVNGQTIAAPAKHYRLTTALERQFAVGSADQLECVRLSTIWINSFGGQPYDCDQHVIASRPKGNWLFGRAAAQFPGLDPGPLPPPPPPPGGTPPPPPPPPPPSGDTCPPTSEGTAATNPPACDIFPTPPPPPPPGGTPPPPPPPPSSTPGPYNYYVGQ